MICIKCGAQMILYDKDFDFPGKGEKYYCCENENCDCECIETIRFNQVTQRDWSWDGDIQKVEKVAWSFPTNLDGGEF